MGITGSKEGGGGTMRRVGSSSAAFGRLRIDSPRTPMSSTRRRQQLRLLAEQQGGGGGSSPMIGAGYSTEHSPLLTPKQHHHYQRPTMETIQSGLELETSTVPPLAVWILPALCCALAYALYNIFIKKGSSHINPVLGGVILQLVAAVLGCCLLSFLVVSTLYPVYQGYLGVCVFFFLIPHFLFYKPIQICFSYQIRDGGSEVISFDMEGVQWAILAGLSVGAAEIISFFVSSLGVQAMQSIPIIIGGSVMFGTVLGAVALQEELSYRGWMGVVMISVGISLVGLDSQDDGV